jgi:Plasmid pRiA4b ORF-3-like protein
MPSKKQNGPVSRNSEPTAPNRRRARKADLFYQFKITLHESKPPIWRRIQVSDCTLRDLHELIQAAMGWENCHLHQFIVGDVRYGVPDPELNLKNEAKVRMSQIVSQSGTPFRFKYEYDFGDGWLHDILFESSPPNDMGHKYPVCLEGSRACPPEDVGGVWGYSEFLEAIADPKHERHGELLEWIGGEFDSEDFDAKAATIAMMKAIRRSS